MTLEQLQANTPFSSWEGHVDSKALGESRLIYKTTLSNLMQVGLGQPKEIYIPLLNRFIEEFNRIDEEYEFIATIEREDICDLPAVRNW